ncbi:putative transcription factor [Scale drop disease virus]|uniref:ORF_017L n=1 Tax=Scale drop disease virus TaxID=1697349 RepID=A0A0K1L644_9VIRU|nr:ORF_017L [Scale drop disease virus]AKU37432.1 ORF_017L [Scale drop disease virus]QLI60690.1 putative transcription factor [Scale drop disease virus]QXJ13608.1 ORF017L [Scale drop disease virus]UNH60765.1 putative transcription factor [Scale drop disease virus]
MKPALLSCHNHVISKLKKYTDNQLHMFVLETAPYVMHYLQYGVLNKNQLKIYTKIVRNVYTANNWTYTKEFEDALQNMLFIKGSFPISTNEVVARPTSVEIKTDPLTEKKIDRILLQLSNYIYSYQGIVSANYPVHISNAVIEQIKTQVYKYGMSNHQVTSSHIVSLLKSMKLVKYYEHSAIIYRMLTGKSDTFSETTAVAIQNDIDTICTFIKSSDQNVWKLCIDTGAHYLFFQIMHKNNHPYIRDMFFPAKTLIKKRCQDNACRKLFEMLKWKFWPL